MSSAEALTTTQLILIAGAGGLVLNMINLWEDSKRPVAKRAPKLWLYWLYAVDGSTLRPFLAFSVGLSAPTTLQAMAAKAAIVAGPPSNSES